VNSIVTPPAVIAKIGEVAAAVELESPKSRSVRRKRSLTELLLSKMAF
jgi:hypothetical protein